MTPKPRAGVDTIVTFLNATWDNIVRLNTQEYAMQRKPIDERDRGVATQRKPGDEQNQGDATQQKPIGQQIQESTQAAVGSVQQASQAAVQEAQQEVSAARIPWYRAVKRGQILLATEAFLLAIFGLLAWWVYTHPVLGVD